MVRSGTRNSTGVVDGGSDGVSDGVSDGTSTGDADGPGVIGLADGPGVIGLADGPEEGTTDDVIVGARETEGLWVFVLGVLDGDIDREGAIVSITGAAMDGLDDGVVDRCTDGDALGGTVGESVMRSCFKPRLADAVVADTDNDS